MQIPWNIDVLVQLMPSLLVACLLDFLLHLNNCLQWFFSSNAAALSLLTIL